jgi:hypothetical protein
MIKETIVIDNRTLYKTYHDKYKIKKVETNEVYDEAIDVSPTEYELTDIEKIKEKKGE